MNDAGKSDKAVEVVTARLPSGVAIKVEAVTDSASGDGMTSVGLANLKLADALETVGEIGSLVAEKLRQARPSKTTVELKIGFAVEAGKLTALWVGGKGEAALTVTMEWSGDRERADAGGAADGGESADEGEPAGDGGSTDSGGGSGSGAGSDG
jgi:hypothetical protein